MLGEDEDWLWHVANEMDQEDGLIWPAAWVMMALWRSPTLASKHSPDLSRSTRRIPICLSGQRTPSNLAAVYAACLQRGSGASSLDTAGRSRRSFGSCTYPANTVRKVLRSGATALSDARDGSRCPGWGDGRADPRAAAHLEHRAACPRAADADPHLRGTARARLRGRLRCGAALCTWLASRTQDGDGGRVCAAELALGEAYQFDWSVRDRSDQRCVPVRQKVAHVRLCHSRALFVRAYPRETQEMVFDAHDRAFAFFKGASVRAASTTT